MFDGMSHFSEAFVGLLAQRTIVSKYEAAAGRKLADITGPRSIRPTSLQESRANSAPPDGESRFVAILSEMHVSAAFG